MSQSLDAHWFLNGRAQCSAMKDPFPQLAGRMFYSVVRLLVRTQIKVKQFIKVLSCILELNLIISLHFVTIGNVSTSSTRLGFIQHFRRIFLLSWGKYIPLKVITSYGKLVSPYHGSSAELMLVGVEPGTLRFRVDVITTAPQLINYMSPECSMSLGTELLYL